MSIRGKPWKCSLKRICTQCDAPAVENDARPTSDERLHGTPVWLQSQTDLHRVTSLCSREGTAILSIVSRQDERTLGKRCSPGSGSSGHNGVESVSTLDEFGERQLMDSHFQRVSGR